MDRRSSLKLTVAAMAHLGMGGAWISLNSCQSDIIGSNNLLVLSENQLSIVTLFSDIVIPRTDTPGASDVGVPQSIDQILFHSFDLNNRNQILDGINRIDLLSREQYLLPFLDLDIERQKKLVTILSSDASQSPNPKNHLFFILRGLVIMAFFRSETANKKVLKFDPVPGIYLPCIPLNKVGGLWAH
jgi:hypothetical protein